MSALMRWGTVAVLGGMTLWADSGIRPRPSAQQYGTSAQVPHATVAATALSARDVHNTFAADLSKEYVVLEVAVYPDKDGNVTISPEDFMLKPNGQGALIRPAEPGVIATALRGDKGNPGYGGNSRKTIDVVPTASVEHVSGVYTDPNTGQQRNGGWITSTGVQVYGPVGGGSSVGGPSGASSGRDRETIESELADKSLPEGTIGQPTAGYLYFPVPKGGKKNAGYELQYLGQQTTVKLNVPAPPSK